MSLESEQLNIIRQAAREFIAKMGFEAEIEAEFKNEENQVVLNLGTSDPKDMIGQGGENLLAIQHLLAQILRKKIGQPIFLDLDINSYKKRRLEFIRELARGIADQVSLSKKPVILEAMKPYERRVVHLEIAQRTDVVTESIGEEPQRCVQIKPYP